METRNSYSSDLSDEITKQEHDSFATQSYRAEKTYQPTKATEDDKKLQKDIIISGPLFFDSRRQMYYYRRGNGNLMADGTIDGQPINHEKNSFSPESSYFCRIL